MRHHINFKIVYSNDYLVGKWVYYSNFKDFFYITIPWFQGMVPWFQGIVPWNQVMVYLKPYPEIRVWYPEIRVLFLQNHTLKSGYGYGSYVTHSLRCSLIDLKIGTEQISSCLFVPQLATGIKKWKSFQVIFIIICYLAKIYLNLDWWWIFTKLISKMVFWWLIATPMV